MAQAVPVQPQPMPGAGPRPGRAAWAVAGVLAGTALQGVGGYWDMAWHLSLGRESFWSPPHLLLLAATTALWLRQAAPGAPLARPVTLVLLAGLLAAVFYSLAEAEFAWFWRHVHPAP